MCCFQHIPVAESLPTGSAWGLGGISGCSGRVGGSRLGWGREPWDMQAAGLVLCELVDTRTCPAKPYNVLWVLECSGRGVSSRAVPFMDAEVK